MKLTKVERCILSNQNRILAALYPDMEQYYQHLAEVAEGGYPSLYYELFENVYDGVTEEICEETFSILEMFRVINNSIGALSVEDQENIDKDKLRFKGFDLNNDPHYSFTDFLINKENRYSEYKEMYLNSHSSGTLHNYRRLKLKYDSLISGKLHYALNYEELNELQQS